MWSEVVALILELNENLSGQLSRISPIAWDSSKKSGISVGYKAVSAHCIEVGNNEDDE